MNALSDSSFSYIMFIKAMDVRWCSWLVTNCAPNIEQMVAKLSMKLGSKKLNQYNASSLSKMEKAYTIWSLEVYNAIWFMNIFRC